ncbi:helix-turn-helix domain-containing protein [Proteus vulgaris]|uniref:YdaS family helix-turn-helix protein n=1 Tax=Proteus faecis TaxID=2050967 RepID=A0AAW7CR29_9GAMM|nr:MULTISPECIES: YdaS family helix-turn-helix protein [Proteus]MBG5986718.1 helix-turn-helix domain-containing protein [Proteus vulgaris]MBW3472744.1 helix-turn-helix domain-containing protein [Proteus vulgaris]MDL5168642.1 YdaS family helix-turn-helix protein [Proteus faecis]MDL5276605.1 YdaS family helix-turn-helix protein [Proteus faecis]MDL5280172.1 YdaS family helix-turn-helix protein [Proteus faecis]
MSKTTNIDCVIGLKKAIDKSGGQTRLAKLITDVSGKTVKQQQIWNWLNRNKRIPSDKVLLVELVTGIPRNKLRPDLYPTEANSLPKQ